MGLAEKLIRDSGGDSLLLPSGWENVVDAEMVDVDTAGRLRPFTAAELVREEGVPVRTPEPAPPPTVRWREFLVERQMAEDVGKEPEKEERPPGRWVIGKFVLDNVGDLAERLNAGDSLLIGVVQRSEA